MTKLTVAFRNFANAPKNCKKMETESMEDVKKVKYIKMKERKNLKKRTKKVISYQDAEKCNFFMLFEDVRYTHCANWRAFEV